MTSNQSSAGYQNSSFRNRAANSGAAQPRSDCGIERVHLLGIFEGQISRDTQFKMEDDEGEAASQASKEAQKQRDARKKDKERKRAEREKIDAEGNAQYIVIVPKDNKAVQATMKAVAESAVSQDKLYSAVVALVENENLPEIVTSVVKTRGFGHLLVELSEREDLREFTEAAAANDELFLLLAAVAADPTLQEILRAIMTAPALAGLLLEITRRGDLKTLTESVASDAKLLSAAAAMVADGSLLAMVRSASTAPGLADLLLEISRRDDLRKLTAALSANVLLVDAASELANANGELLASLAGIIRAATGIAAAGGDPALATGAVAVALQDPEATVKAAAVRQAGGMRAKITNWLLGTG
jgi:hypothetical protein